MPMATAVDMIVMWCATGLSDFYTSSCCCSLCCGLRGVGSHADMILTAIGRYTDAGAPVYSMTKEKRSPTPEKAA